MSASDYPGRYAQKVDCSVRSFNRGPWHVCVTWNSYREMADLTANVWLCAWVFYFTSDGEEYTLGVYRSPVEIVHDSYMKDEQSFATEVCYPLYAADITSAAIKMARANKQELIKSILVGDTADNKHLYQRAWIEADI